jgi:hypothetical protein
VCWQFIRPPIRLPDGGQLLLAHVVCLPRAVSTSPGSPDRSPRVFTRHFGTDGRARVDAANVPPSAPRSIVARSTSGAPREPPGVRETGLSRSKKNAGACQSPSAGNSGSTRSHTPGPSRRARRHPEACREALTSASGVLMSRRDDRGVLPPSNEGVGLCMPIEAPLRA